VEEHFNLGSSGCYLQGVEPAWYFRVEYQIGGNNKEKIVIATSKEQAIKKVRAFVKKETPKVAGDNYRVMALREVKNYEPIS